MNLKNRDKILCWIDQKDKKKSEADSVEAPVALPLARIIPMNDTINFEKKVVTHHKKFQKDVTSCLRGTKLNKFQKQKDNKLMSSSHGMA
jgi:hypothetical protein